MIVDNIHDGWGTVVTSDLPTVLKQGKSFWRNIAYNRDLIVFKGFGDVPLTQLYQLYEFFGIPWNDRDYRHSLELQIPIDDHGDRKWISEISSKNLRIGDKAMPWHADIPNSEDMSFPWRALYMVSNPNPHAGFTDWLNIRLDLINPTPEQLDVWKRTQVLNHSWHRPGNTSEVRRLDFIKTHPITGVQSLRTNFFHHDTVPGSKNAWIQKTFTDGKEVDNMEFHGRLHHDLERRRELYYRHQWSNYDVVLYDNYSFVHRRTHLQLGGAAEPRKMVRCNIHHETSR